MSDNTVLKTYWEGPLSKLENLAIKSIIANGHTLFIYTYDTRSIKSFHKNMVVLDASDIIPLERREKTDGGLSAKTISQTSRNTFANFFRYCLLYKTGGWWFDLDIVLLKPVTTEMPVVIPLHFSIDKKNVSVNNAPLKIPRGHILAESLVKSTSSMDLSNLVRCTIGPTLLEKTVRDMKLDQYLVSSDVYSPIGWGEIHRIIEPKFGFDRITKDTVAIHLFNFMWSYGRNIDKNGKHHPDSLYEWLKRKYEIL